MLALLLLLAVLATMPASASAAPGDLDRGFGEDGRVIGHRWTLVDMTTLADGRTVVATESALFAYRGNGRPDRSFGNNGAVEPLSPEGGKLTIEDIAVDGHGRILAVGSAAHPVAPAPGTVPVGNGTYAAIVRYLPDGELDGGFGSNGIVFTDLGLPPPARPPKIPDYAQITSAVEVRALGVAVDSGERIVLTGTRAATHTAAKYATFVPFPEAFVARLSEDGGRDSSFGENGARPLGGLRSIGRPAIDRRAGVYFAATQHPTSEFAERPKVIGHLTVSGAVDRTFGKGGWRALANDTSETDLDVTLDRGGRLLIYGQGSSAGIARFKPNGSLDRGFGRGGTATVVHPKGEVIVGGLAATGSGGVLVAGSLVIEPTSARGGFKRKLLLARLTERGKLARRSGNRGTVVTRFGAESQVEGRVVLADGRGHALVGGVLDSSRFVLARYLLGR